jgi:hypothetical protein
VHVLSPARVAGEALAAAGVAAGGARVIALTIGDQYLTLLWIIIVAIVGGIVWLIRLEGTTKNNTRDVERLQKDFDGGMGRIASAIRETETRTTARLERIEGYLMAAQNGHDR